MKNEIIPFRQLDVTFPNLRNYTCLIFRPHRLIHNLFYTITTTTNSFGLVLMHLVKLVTSLRSIWFAWRALNLSVNSLSNSHSPIGSDAKINKKEKQYLATIQNFAESMKNKNNKNIQEQIEEQKHPLRMAFN